MVDKKITFDNINETRLALLNLKNLKIEPTIADYYGRKIELTIQLFDFGAKAFKSGQQIIDGFDTRILNEYQYFSRAQNTFISLSRQNTLSSDALLAIDDALSAVRHIINDTLDLIVTHASIEIKRLNNICETEGIADVIKDVGDVYILLSELHETIAQTREVRGVARIEYYIDIFVSGKYEKLIDFCQTIPMIEDALKKRKRREYLTGKRWFVGLVMAFLLGLVGVLLKAFS